MDDDLLQAASDAFGLKGLDAGFLGLAVPTLEPGQSERFAIAVSISEKVDAEIAAITPPPGG